MFFTPRLLAASAVLIFGSVAAANAADCRSITDVKKRMDCIEDTIKALPAPPAPVDLSGMKIEQAAHPGICLYFRDLNQPALSMACSDPAAIRFNIQK